MIFATLNKITDKLFQERSNINASLAVLLEFSQLVCFTYGNLVGGDKSKSTLIEHLY